MMSFEAIKGFFKGNWALVVLTLLLVLVFVNYGYVLPLDFRGGCDEGDFGRDLYYYYLASKGQLPYIDFNWIYGPLTPVLYGLVFRIFGVSAFNALTVWYLFYITSIYLIYFIVKIFSSPKAGLLAALIFILFYENLMIPVFNHVSGLPFILLSLWFLKKYLENYDKKYVYWLAVSCFFITITKLNMGMAFSGPVFFFLFIFGLLNKQGIKHILGATGVYFALNLLIYGGLILHSPLDQLNKSFPYSSNNLMVSTFSFWENLFMSHRNFVMAYSNYTIDQPVSRFLFDFFTFNWWYFVVIVAGFIAAVVLFRKEGKASKAFIYTWILSFAALGCTHEFILTGKNNTLKAWSLAIIIVLGFYVYQVLARHFADQRYFKIARWAVLLFIIIGVGYKSYIFFQPYSYHRYYCKNDRLKINVIYPHWYKEMNYAIKYILATTDEGDKLLTLPYNNYYNFVTNRLQPSRYTEFLWISGVTEEDQKKVIEDIEENKVKVIMYSIKRSNPQAFGFGTFGQTHGFILDKYIKDNYEIDENFKTIYFGVYFYLRKTPFKEK
jgi:hypothetical protein